MIRALLRTISTSYLDRKDWVTETSGRIPSTQHRRQELKPSKRNNSDFATLLHLSPHKLAESSDAIQALAFGLIGDTSSLFLDELITSNRLQGSGAAMVEGKRR